MKIPFTDLEETGVAGFLGRLAIVGPFESRAQLPDTLASQIQTVARKGAGVVWIQPPRDRHEPLQPSFSVVPVNARGIVTAQADMVAGLADNPRSQLNLLHFVRLALQPELPRP
jgi:hypothetical protein